METVTQAPVWQATMVGVLPLLFLAGSIILLVVVLRYFVGLQRDVKAIRQLLEESRSHGG